MTEIFLKIVNMSLSASWLILLVLVLRLVLTKTPKWSRVLLWGIVAVRLICPSAVESTLSLIPSAETIPMDIAMEPIPTLNSGIGAINNAVNPILSSSNIPANVGDSINPLQIAVAVAANLWILGMASLLVYSALSYWRLSRKIDTAVLYRDNIFQSENVCSPFVLGILRPRIYLPFQIAEQTMEYVIAHEQAHILRKDHWWKPLGFLLLTIHWFNPLIWLAYILLCRDIELACDERVIKLMDNERRADYTQALMSFSVRQRKIAGCPLAFGETAVKKRIKSVMNYKKPAFWLIVLAVAVCVFAAVCFLTDPPAVQGDELLADTTPSVMEWFDYLDAPDTMDRSQDLEYRMPAFENVRFLCSYERMYAVNDIGTTLLYTGMPIWNAYFCDLTGDGLPELCSTVSFGSGIIDSRIIVMDYANGVTYTMDDRGVYDYMLHLDNESGRLYIDKTDYHSGALVSSGQLVFEDGGIRIAEVNAEKNTDINVDYEPKGVSGDNVKELSTMDRGIIWTDGLAFEALSPGEEIVSSSEIAIETEGSSLLLTITWDRTGLFLEYGLRAENGTEYFQEKQGGISTLKIENLPVGVYRLYVKNSDAYHGVPAYEQPADFDVSFDATGAMLYCIENVK